LKSGRACGRAMMERACDVLNIAECIGIPRTLEDPITRFGSPKRGWTLAKWGFDRTISPLRRAIIRNRKPDIICPNVSRYPRPTRHHRAMTEAAHLVIPRAADPRFRLATCPPWQVQETCNLPAWSAGGPSLRPTTVPPPARKRLTGKIASERRRP